MTPAADSPTRNAVEFVRGIGELPVLGPATVELLRTLEAESTDVRRVVRVMARDPLLAAKVMRVANSSYYGSASTLALDQALIRIGLREVRNVVLTSAVIGAFPERSGFDLAAYWRHCIASGLAARRLALAAPALSGGGVDDEGMYVCGLLHHLGIFLHAYFRGDDFRAARELGRAEGLPLFEAERRTLGFDHAESAAALLERWDFPVEVRSAARHHHEPETAPEEHRNAARVLHVAAMLCHAQQGDEGSFEGAVEGFDERAWFALGFDAGDLEPMQAAVAEVSAQAAGLAKELFA